MKKENNVGPDADQFWSTRGQAIGAYAGLEQSLCFLFAHLAGVPRDIAGIIFFKITSARSRNAALEDLLKKRYKTKYNVFWKSYFKQLHHIDTRRHTIVHWAAVTKIDTADPGNPIVTMSLFPPRYWAQLAEIPEEIDTPQMVAFIEKCDVFARACNIFITSLMQAVEPPPEMFGQPLTYPLPDGHPLSRRKRGAL